MSSIRALAKHARSLSRTVQTRPIAHIRDFHSPFALLSSSESPLTSPPPPPQAALYEKQSEYSPEPRVSSAGTQTYVVSDPDPANTPYEVPSGAYPTSAPYQEYTRTEAPSNAPRASTANAYAHPITTNAVPHNESGVGDSAAVRHREAQGELHAKGGSYGGLGLMDKEGTTKKSSAELADRNPPPDRPDVAEKFSKLGVDNAWKARK
ncbi:hypothetical protein K474DRAFT_1663341 [Panus rudis PR-1116 ss-1]|nr:hypothetical protein K474DRAFT_1663341 [Panus rudis PR-1116 ss-1]